MGLDTFLLLSQTVFTKCAGNLYEVGEFDFLKGCIFLRDGPTGLDIKW